MSDIVERLRDADGLDGGDVLSPLCHEAANEIERLQRLTEQYDRLDIERIAEIERLQAIIVTLRTLRALEDKG